MFIPCYYWQECCPVWKGFVCSSPMGAADGFWAVIYKKDREPRRRKGLGPSPCPLPTEWWGWASLLSVHWVGCTNCPVSPALNTGSIPGARRGWDVLLSVIVIDFVQCLSALYFSFFFHFFFLFPNRLCLIHCLIHLISFWFEATIPEVCTELVSSLTSFGRLRCLKMGNLICSDGLSLSDFSPRVKMLMPLDSPSLAAAAWVCMMYPFQAFDFSSVFNIFPLFLCCFPGGVIVLMSVEASLVTPSVWHAWPWWLAH